MFYEPLPMILKQLSGESDDRRMQWRHGPRSGLEGRHRAIGDVIAWSYELCADKQRLLFDRLSVFAPGYDVNPEDADTGVADIGAELEAIEAVCADDVPIDGCEDSQITAGADQASAAISLARNEVRELLDGLVEQSLVSIHITADTVRYFLLETLRLFAADRLAERSTNQIDEPARLARRHYHYYRDKVIHASANWCSPAEQDLLDWVRTAWDNIRQAMQTSISSPDEARIGLEIVSGLIAMRMPFFAGSLPSMRRWAERALEATRAQSTQPTALQTTAMALIGWIALCQGQVADAEQILEDCAAVCIPDDPEVRRNWRRSPESDLGLPPAVEFTWGTELMLKRDASAITVLARARDKYSELGDRGGESMSSLWGALAANLLSADRQALDIAQRHLENARECGALLAKSWADMMWAIAVTKHGRAADALLALDDALTVQIPAGDRWGGLWAVIIRTWSLAQLIRDLLAAEKADRNRITALATEVAQLAGGARTSADLLKVNMDALGPFADETNAAVDAARGALGQKAFVLAERQGSQLRPEHHEVQRLALGTLSIKSKSQDQPATMGASSSWQTLSEAEQEVAILAAAGWPNSAIGVRRGTSTKTAEAQISSILQKLMIKSRKHIHRFIPEEQRNRVSAEHAHTPRQATRH
jgi:DNA-binding CsgD family transcriptional regulator